MSFLKRLRTSDGSVASLLATLLPGGSPGILALRRDAEALALDPLARGALILGSAGSGKSTLARAVALGRYVGTVTPERAKAFFSNVGSDGPFRISPRSLDWYIEFSLPGLAASLAEAQLFGFVAEVASHGSELSSRRGPSKGRASLFEQAQMGRGVDDPEKRTTGAIVTGGVVFLDEIGDLDATLQPKLLTVLTGGTCYRVGGEGREDASFQFDGLTLAATWRPLGNLRPDLLARLQDHVLRVPSLSERPDELDALTRAFVEEIKAEYMRWWSPRSQVADSLELDKQRLDATFKRVRDFEAKPPLIAAVRKIDWSSLGDLRALQQVVRRVMLTGQDVDDVVATIPRGEEPQEDPLLECVFEMSFDGVRGLGDALNFAQAALRRRAIEAIGRDPALAAKVASHLGLRMDQVSRQGSDVKRRAKRRGDPAGKKR